MCVLLAKVVQEGATQQRPDEGEGKSSRRRLASCHVGAGAVGGEGEVLTMGSYSSK